MRRAIKKCGNYLFSCLKAIFLALTFGVEVEIMKLFRGLALHMNMRLGRVRLLLHVLDIFSLFDWIGQQRMQLVFSRHQPSTYALYPQFLC